MSNVVKLPKVKRADTFAGEVNQRARFSNQVIFTDHLIEQMADRDVNRRQVMTVLRKGQALEDATFNDAKGTFEGRMAYAGGGREIRVVCAIADGNLQIYGITVY